MRDYEARHRSEISTDRNLRKNSFAVATETSRGQRKAKNEGDLGKIGEALRRSDPSGGPVCEPNRTLAQVPGIRRSVSRRFRYTVSLRVVA
jgi:hypothetical protein